MKAVALTHYLPVDHAESLFDTELPTPAYGANDLLVEVKAVSVNPLDNRVRRPKDKVEPQPRVLGWDAAGVVVAVGSEVSLFRPGDRVYYAGELGRQGSNSELQAVDQHLVGGMPATFGFGEAAALPMSALTAWEALFDRLRVGRARQANAGKSILIVGAAGGVGSMAVQLAGKVAGLRVIATASREASAAWVRHMGAHDVIDHHANMSLQLAALGLQSVDYILLVNDSDAHLPAASRLVAPQGAICIVAEATKPIDFGPLWEKSASLVWEMVFTRVEAVPGERRVHHDILTQVARLVDEGTIISTIGQVISPINAATVREAHAMLAAGKTIGKIVLKDF
jgi:zinc-binding alcohol dehydrogenase family protein